MGCAAMTMTQRQNILDRLEAWHHATDLAVAKEAHAEIARLQDAKRAALAIADERSKENVGLRAALKPFADLAAMLPPDVIPDHWPVRVSQESRAGDTINVAHLRVAARVLEQSATGETT
jgi:hypothetical protein